MSRRVWDVRVVWIEKRQRWWWNAWRESTGIELYGFAETRDVARNDMYAAIEAVTVTPIVPDR